MPRSTESKRKVSPPLSFLISNQDTGGIPGGRPRRSCTFKNLNDKDENSDDSNEDVPVKVSKAKPTRRSSKTKEKALKENVKSPKNDKKTLNQATESDAENPTVKSPVKTRKRKIEPVTDEPENEALITKPKRQAGKKSPKEEIEPVPSTSKGTKSENPPKIFPNLFSDPDTDDDFESNLSEITNTKIVSNKTKVATEAQTEPSNKNSKPATEAKAELETDEKATTLKPSKLSENNNVIECEMPVLESARSRVIPNSNFAHSLFNFSSNISSSYDLERKSRSAIVHQISQFRVFKSVTPFDRRVTSLAWHPKEPTLCAVGSKAGDILLWNYVKDEFQSLLKGIGPGGSIQGMKFDTENSNRIYTCSIDGKFAAKDFGGKQDNVFLNTDNWDKWYTSFDVSNAGGTLMAGDNNGNVTLMTTQGEQVWKARLHKSKVTNIQFSPREPWLVITTSTDNTVKVWDIRVLGSGSSSTVTSSKGGVDNWKEKFLQSLEHDKPVNSAYFSPLDGTRLLTTDQHSQLRVYRAPFWALERSIPHPHRQFQHLTPIRATWHPLVDMVVAGRYPDEKFSGHVPGELRTIDCLDVDTGSTLVQLHEPGLNMISSLNQFSGSGDALLSGMGQTVLIWKQKPEESEVSAYQERISNLKDVMVQEWPGYKPVKKSKSKKLKVIEDVD